MELLINALIIISGICWSIVYVDSIRIGFKQKTYAMPLFALGLNIVWEGLYAFTDIFVRQSIGAQAIANACWFLLDCVIVYTYFKFGKSECRTETERKWFIPWSVLAFAACIALQVLFYCWFGSVEGEKYAAYLQNVAMSLLYLSMLKERRSDKALMKHTTIGMTAQRICRWLFHFLLNSLYQKFPAKLSGVTEHPAPCVCRTHGAGWLCVFVRFSANHNAGGGGQACPAPTESYFIFPAYTKYEYK